MIKSLNIRVLFPKMAQVVAKGTKWSPKAMEAAAQAHQYIKIGDKPGHLLLSGAPGRWKKAVHSGDVYVPSLRVAGNPAAIRQLFLALGNDANTVDQHLARSYSAANYQSPGYSAAFDAEVAAYKAWKEGKDAQKKVAGGAGVSLAQLQYFVDNLPAATTVARTTAAGSPRAGASPGRAPRVQNLASRLAEAQKKGKVLDVSKMDVAKGTGIKMINPPGANSKKIGVQGLAIVSSDPALFAHAVRQLGGNADQWIAAYNSRLAAGGNIAAPAALPAATTLPAVASPLAGGVALPIIPGTLGGFPGTLPYATSPIGSPK